MRANAPSSRPWAWEIDMDFDDDTDTSEGYAAPQMDPFLAAIALCEIAQRAKPISAALKKLRRVGRDIAAAEQKLAALSAETEQKQAALAEREAAIVARETMLDKREDEFRSSCEEARDDLRRYYDSIAEADRHVRYRILASADL